MELQRRKEQPLEKCRKCSSRYRYRSIAGFRPCSPCKNREVPGCGVRASRATVILRQCGRTPKVHGAPERARVTINGISLIGHLIGLLLQGTIHNAVQEECGGVFRVGGGNSDTGGRRVVA